MISAQDVQAFIAAGLPCEHLRVEGEDCHHFEALIVSTEFVGKSRVQRQQRVYAVVGERMAKNEIHALAMQCHTPEEWKKLHG